MGNQLDYVVYFDYRIKTIIKNAPNWLKVTTVLVFLYALANLMFFLKFPEGGTPSFIEGKYVLQNHGEIIRELTYEEFRRFKANKLRGFSGHWIAFYCVAMAILYPEKRTNDGLAITNSSAV